MEVCATKTRQIYEAGSGSQKCSKESVLSSLQLAQVSVCETLARQLMTDMRFVVSVPVPLNDAQWVGIWNSKLLAVLRTKS